MRKEKDIIIHAEGRDKGKVFHITEMAAEQAEWWAVRAMLALGRSNPDLGQAYDEGAGMGALAIAGLKAFMRVNPDDAKPLLDEMMTCVKIKPDPKRPDFVRPLLPEDIDEFMTRVKIRSEVFELHTGFSLPGSRSK